MNKPKSTSKRSGKAWGAALLLLCLLALVLGVFGAVYFEQSQPGTPQVASTQPSAPSPTTGPVAPAPVAPPPAVTSPAPNNPSPQAVPSPESTTTTQAAQATGAAPAEAPPAPSSAAAQRLARISPSAAPANVAAAAPRYWVEFGAYEGAFYADRLKQSLGKLGIAATVSEAPGAHGRRYLRVRGSDQDDRNAALAQLGKAQNALHIAPLLHRVAAVSPAATRTARAPTASRGRHWVQFGAFRARKNAEEMLNSLRKSGIQSSVIKIKTYRGSTLYLVRTADLPDRAAATQIAERGSAALHSKDVLIGETPHHAGLNPRAPPR